MEILTITESEVGAKRRQKQALRPVSKGKNSESLPPALPQGIYVPQGGDQDYYKVDLRDLASPPPSVTLTEPKAKPKAKTKATLDVDKQAIFYNKTASCITKYLPSRRNAYIEHLMRQYSVNAAKIVIAQYPDVMGYAMPSRVSTGLPLAVKLPVTPAQQRLQKSIISEKRKAAIHRHTLNTTITNTNTVIPVAPSPVERQKTGLTGSPRRKMADELKTMKPVAVESRLPEMPAMCVRLTWNTPREHEEISLSEGQETKPHLYDDNVKVSLSKPTNNEHNYYSNRIPLAIKSNSTLSQYNQELGLLENYSYNSSQNTTRENTTTSFYYQHNNSETDIQNEEKSSYDQQKSSEGDGLPGGVESDIKSIKGRQFRSFKAREKTTNSKPKWKENLIVEKERPKTTVDESKFQPCIRELTESTSSSNFFKVSRPLRLHQRDEHFMYPDLQQRAVTSYSFQGERSYKNPNCVMCQSGWDLDRITRSDTVLPRLQCE